MDRAGRRGRPADIPYSHIIYEFVMPRAVPHSAIVDGAPMTWRAQGEGATMALIHGIGGSSESWTPTLAAFAPSQRVVAWDAPGYGGSAFDAGHPTVESYARRLQGLLKQLEAEPEHVIAHSIGSPIAVALLGLLPAGCIRSLTLVHPVSGFGGLDPERREALRAARLADIDGVTMAAFGTQRAPQILGSGAAPAVVDEVARIIGRIPQRAYRAMVEVMSSANLIVALPSVTVPTLVIAGTEDDVAPPESCQRVAEALPSGQYEELDGAGHYAPLEQPEAFLALVRDFVERADGA